MEKFLRCLIQSILFFDVIRLYLYFSYCVNLLLSLSLSLHLQELERRDEVRRGVNPYIMSLVSSTKIKHCSKVFRKFSLKILLDLEYGN